MRFLLLLTLTLPLLAQEVILDFRKTAPVQVPTRVDPPVQLHITVRNVNDFLYSYRGSISVDPSSDVKFNASQLSGLFSSPDCTAVDKDAKDLKAGLNESFRLKAAADGTYPSIPLSESQKQWNGLKEIYARLNKAPAEMQKCDGWKDFDKNDRSLASALDKADRGQHEYPFSATLTSNGTVSVTIEEFYNGTPTKDGKKTYSFATGSNQFFLSVGFLATAVQSRSYDIVDVGIQPAVPAKGDQPAVPEKTLKEFRVQGTGKFRPAGIVLLNYKLPCKRCLSERFGVALSSGLVYRTSQSGGNTTATNFGIFAGGSIHLWERFWITPGVHIGEFSDFPKGLFPGAPVPNGYPSSFTGVNRWTTRFGVGITFRAADFKAALGLVSKDGSTTTGAKNDTSAKGAADNATPSVTTTVPAGTSTNPVVKAIEELKASIAKSTDDLAAKKKTQAAAQTKSDAATKAATDAAKDLTAKKAAADAKKTAKEKTEADVRAATDKLKAATSAEDRDAALKVLQDAQAALSKASGDYGAAQVDQQNAEKAAQATMDAATDAGKTLASAIADTAKTQQELNDLTKKLKEIQDSAGAGK